MNFIIDLLIFEINEMEKKPKKEPKPKVSQEVLQEEVPKKDRKKENFFQTFCYWDSEEAQSQTRDEVRRY